MKKIFSLILVLSMVFSVGSIAFGADAAEPTDRVADSVFYVNLADIEASDDEEVSLFEDVIEVDIPNPFQRNGVVNTYVAISGVYNKKLGYITVQTRAYVDNPSLAVMRWIEGTHYVEVSSEVWKDSAEYYELSSLGTSSISASNTFYKTLRVGETYWIDSIGEWIHTLTSGRFVRSTTFIVQ